MPPSPSSSGDGDAAATIDAVPRRVRGDGRRVAHRRRPLRARLGRALRRAGGYTPRMVEAVKGLLESAGVAADAFSKVALYAPDARSHGGVARALKLDKGAGAGSALRSPRQQRLLLLPRTAGPRTRDGEGRRSHPGRELRRRRRGAGGERDRPARQARRATRGFVAPRAPPWRRLLRPLPEGAQPQRHRVRAAEGPGPLGDDPLPGDGRGHEPGGPALPQLRGRAVPRTSACARAASRRIEFDRRAALRPCRARW